MIQVTVSGDALSYNAQQITALADSTGYTSNHDAGLSLDQYTSNVGHTSSSFYSGPNGTISNSTYSMSSVGLTLIEAVTSDTYSSIGKSYTTDIELSTADINFTSYSRTQFYSTSDVDNNGTTTSTRTHSNFTQTITNTLTSATGSVQTTTTYNTTRQFSDTISTAATYTLTTSTNNAGTGSTTTSTSTYSVFTSTTNSTSTSFQGLLKSTTATTTHLQGGFNETYSMQFYEDYSTKNEWAWSASTSLSQRIGFLDEFGVSEAVHSQKTRQTYAWSFFTSSTSVLGGNFTITQTQSFEATSTTTFTYVGTSTTTGNSLYTALTSFSYLPFPTSSSTGYTETLSTTVASTETNGTSTGSSSTQLTISGVAGFVVFQTFLTTTASDITLRTTTNTTFFYNGSHSSVQVSSTGATTIDIFSIISNSTQLTGSGGMMIAYQTSSSTSAQNPGSSVSATFSTAVSQTVFSALTKSRTPMITVLATIAPPAQTFIKPVVLQGFRMPGQSNYSDTYGSSVSVSISNSTRIPWPYFSGEQHVGVSFIAPTPILTTISDTALSQTWSVSASSNSVSFTFSQTSSAFTSTDSAGATALTNTTTVSATWTATGSFTASTSLQSTQETTTSSTVYAFGGFADVSTVQESASCGSGGYMQTIRPRTGGADSTSKVASWGLNSFLQTANLTNAIAFEPGTVATASQAVNGTPVVTIAKWSY